MVSTSYYSVIVYLQFFIANDKPVNIPAFKNILNEIIFINKFPTSTRVLNLETRQGRFGKIIYCDNYTDEYAYEYHVKISIQFQEEFSSKRRNFYSFLVNKQERKKKTARDTRSIFNSERNMHLIFFFE